MNNKIQCLEMFMQASGFFSISYMKRVLQTSFSLYLHNQWTDFHKLSYAGKPQMRAICTYVVL